MVSRRSLLRSSASVVLAGPLLAMAGCGSGQFLSPLSVSATTITPNGGSQHAETTIGYSLAKRADVSATLIGPDGKTTYQIRPPQTRMPDQYVIAFSGVAPVPGKTWLRVVPDGTYRLVVQAKAGGQMVTREATITVQNADTTPPEIADVSVQYHTFTPNGDGDKDTTTIGYKLTKKAVVRIYATNASGGFFLIQAPTKIDASLQSVVWDGTQGGGAVLPDGKYAIHVEATDTAGNFTDYVTAVAIANGGTPRAEITTVKFTPLAIDVGGDLHVTAVVKNTGTVPIKTLGPPSGFKYTTAQTYASFHNPDGVPTYFERGGVWRLAVGWQNQAEPYPLRWGFFDAKYLTTTTDGSGKPDGSGTFTRDLQPGEEVTVSGTITIGDDMKVVNAQRFFAGLEQGGVGFPTGQVGQVNVTIGF